MKRQKSLKSFFRKEPRESEAEATPSCSNTEAEAALQSSPESSPNAESQSQSTTLTNNPLDIGCYLKVESSFVMDEELKFKLASAPWTPGDGYNFPKRMIGGKNRGFSHSWLKRFPWLAYSEVAGGAVCKPCVLFAARGGIGKGSHAMLGQLVSTPYVNWKNAIEDFNKHSVNGYHKHAVQACDDFLAIKGGTKQNVVQALSQQSEKEREMQVQVLGAIIETILLCGRQEIALRGSDDSGRVLLDQPANNDGNFRALLRYRMKVGDKVLTDYMKTAPPVALYTSPMIQNELIDIISEQISEMVIDRVKKASFFTVMADETTDIRRVSQMSLCVRYVDATTGPVICVREDFLGFFPVVDATGQGLSTLILAEGKAKGLDFSKCRGQGYDGAGAMKGKFKGVQACVRQAYPKALYTHCSSHCLNLSLNDAANLSEVKQCMGTLAETCNFFNRSSIRSKILLRALNESPETSVVELAKVCEHRWVERHRSVLIFVEAIVPVVTALENLVEGNEDACDSEEREKTPGSLHKAICNFPFLVTILILERCMSITLSLSRYLQTVNIDLVAAMAQVESCMKLFESMRESDSVFDEIYEKAMGIGEQLGVDEAKPRTVGTQRYRSNQPASSTKEYFKRSVYYPYLDHLLSSLNDRFIEHRREIEGLVCVIPCEVNKWSLSDLKPALDFYSDDLCSNNAVVLQGEWEVWQRKWISIEKAPRNAIDSLNVCNKNLFPNMYKLLEILATLPVTTASNERCFSLLKRLKTWLRNRIGEERLVGLSMISVYRDLSFDVKACIVRFLAKKKRRIVNM